MTGTSKIIGSIDLKENQDYTWEFGEAVFDSYVFAASETVGQAEEILSSDSELEESESTWSSCDLLVVMQYMSQHPD